MKKDRILSDYLVPYLAKVSHIGRPILIVDAFSGPGKYNDGSPGSPLLICEKSRQAMSRDNSTISVICIEREQDLFDRLQRNVATYDFAVPRKGAFSEYASEVANYSKSHTLFVYLDPYSVAGLNWAEMKAIFSRLGTFHSVEVLLNFNAVHFVRMGWQRLKKTMQTPMGIDDLLASERAAADSSSFSALDDIVGGDWWKTKLVESTDFGEQVYAVVEGFHELLRTEFRFSCHTPVRSLHTDTLPKYFMMFGSSHPDGLLLMNNCMVNVNEESEAGLDMYNQFELENLILDCARERTSRKSLVVNVVEARFCIYRESDIKRMIGSLLKEERLSSDPKTNRPNDKTEIWRTL